MQRQNLVGILAVVTLCSLVARLSLVGQSNPGQDVIWEAESDKNFKDHWLYTRKLSADVSCQVERGTGYDAAVCWSISFHRSNKELGVIFLARDAGIFIQNPKCWVSLSSDGRVLATTEMDDGTSIRGLKSYEFMKIGLVSWKEVQGELRVESPSP
jgi:hypothetical protein